MKKIIIITVICIALFSTISSIVVVHNNIVENESTNSVNNKGISKNVDYKKVLSGKSVAMIGDSLIAGYGNEKGGLDVYLKEKVSDCNFSNNAVSGSTVTSNTGNDNIVMINQAKNLGGNPDIIIFDGGVNDIIGYNMGFLNTDLKNPIGTVNKNDSNPSNEKTVIADFENVISTLKTRFPNATLCYVQLCLLDDTRNTRFPNATLCYVQLCLLDDTSINMLAKQVEHKDEIKQRRDEFFEQMKLLCEKWNVNYLDISTKFIGTGIEYRQEDWLHINNEGYKMVTPYVLSFLAESISE